MSNDIHITELIPAYALDCLEENEAEQVAAHLSACPACRAELAAYESVVDQLALAAPDADPAPNLKRWLMARVEVSRPAAAGERSSPLWEQLLNLFRRVAPAWGVVGLTLAAVLLAGNVVLWRQARQAGPMRSLALAGTNLAPDAVGAVIVDRDGDHGALVVDGLPELDQAHQYQLWLIQDGQRTSGGVFSVAPDGYGVLWVFSPQPLSSYDAIGITIEPAGGSPSPTGRKVMGGKL